MIDPDVMDHPVVKLSTVESGYSDTLWNLNFSRTAAAYLLLKFEDLVPTRLGSGAI